MERYSLAEETLGYVTSKDVSNSDYRLLVGGSKNVLIDYQKKVKTRSGFTRLGAGNTSLFNNRNAWNWQTSSGPKRSMRFYEDELEVYLESVDSTSINAWTRVMNGLSTTNKLRSTIQKGGNGGWWDDTEKIDLCLMVQGDANIYEWNGAVAIVASFTSTAGLIAVLASAPTAGGSGYVAGDILTITTGNGDATATVTTVNGSGAITAVTILNRGSGYSIGAGNGTSGGSGTSATLAITTIGTGSITKTGTTTFAQNRFYTARNMTVVNVRTGTEYTYVAGADTTMIVGTGDTSALIAGDILIQKVVTTSNKPVSNHVNSIIYNFENQIVIGSAVDNKAYASLNTDFTDFTPNDPRELGDAFILTLDGPCRGITSLGSILLIGAGKSVIFKVTFEQLAVGTTIAETVKIKRLDAGVNQGFLNQETIVPVGNTIFYLTNEVALRTIENPDNLTGINPKTLSNPIKPDFDAETWDPENTFGNWYKSTLFYTAGATSRMYMLNFVEDADGKLFRFWNPPQTVPVGPLTLIEVDEVEQLYGHSNAVPETYLLFDGASDGQYDGMPVEDKLPIECRAVFAYNSYKKKGILKNFDEYFIEGEITTSTTDLTMILRYDYGGMTQEITETIDGSNEAILEGVINYNSLGQASLAVNPLGGLLYPPADARRFRDIKEVAREDFFELQTEFYTNDVDKYWAILTHGANAQISRRIPTNIKV